MNKETIGKVQLAIGIILLIVGIVGVSGGILVKASGKNALDDYTAQIIQEEYGSYENAPTETKLMIAYALKNEGLNQILIRNNERVFGSTSLILIVLSLLFITQGLANKAEN